MRTHVTAFEIGLDVALSTDAVSTSSFAQDGAVSSDAATGAIVGGSVAWKQK